MEKVVHIDTNIRRFRKDLKLTISKLAIKTGITRSSITAYEEARARPPWETMMKLMEFFEVPAEDMYDFIYDPKYVPEWKKSTVETLVESISSTSLMEKTAENQPALKIAL